MRAAYQLDPATGGWVRWPRLAFAVMPLLLAGCASLSADGGFQPIQQAAEERLGKAVQRVQSTADQDAVGVRVAELLSKPLSADSAVQIALLNNRGLQASFQSLGIAEAEMVQASRMPNPGIGLGRMQRGSERETERSLSGNLAHLIALPLTRQIEAQRFAAVQREVSAAVFSLAAESRKAFYAAVAAEQTARYRRDVTAAADAGAELAKRLTQAGNWNKLQQAREHGFFSEAVLNAARAYFLKAFMLLIFSNI